MAAVRQFNKRLTDEMAAIRQSNKHFNDEMDALRQTNDGRIAAEVDVKCAHFQAQLTALQTPREPEVSPEGLEARLAAHLTATVEECKTATRSVLSDTVQPLAEEIQRCSDKVVAACATTEDIRKVSASALESQQESMAHMQEDLDKLSSAFGEDPKACVQKLIDRSVEPIDGRLATVEVHVAVAVGRVDGHDAMINEQGACLEWHGVRLDGLDSMANRHDRDIHSHDRRMDIQDIRFDAIDGQIDDVDVRYDVRCDAIDTRLHGLDAQVEECNGRAGGVDEQLDEVHVRLDTHDTRLVLVHTNGSRLDAHETRLDAQDTRSGVQDSRTDAHDTLFRAYGARLDAHDMQIDAQGRQLGGHNEGLDETHDASAATREEVARIQANLVNVFGSLGDDGQETTMDGTFAQASLLLRSRLRCRDKSVTDLTARIDEVDETLAAEQGKRRSMQADLDGLRGALGDDPKATVCGAIAEAVDPLVTRLDRYEKVSEGVGSRVDKQDETLARNCTDLAGIRARLDDIGDAPGEDPATAVRHITGLLGDLEKEHATLSVRLDGYESLSSEDRRAMSGLRADISQMLQVFGDDPQVTRIPLESRIKYFEDKRYALQDQAEKNQAAIAAVRKDADTQATVPLIDTVKHLDGLVTRQQDEVASLRKDAAVDRARVVRVEGELGAFIELFRVRGNPESLVEAPRKTAHGSLRPEEMAEPALLAPDASVQDVEMGEGMAVRLEGEPDDLPVVLSGNVDEGPGPAMLTHSLGMHGLSDIVEFVLDETPTPDQTSAPDEAPETIEEDSAISVQGAGLIPQTDAREDLLNEGGYGLCSYVWSVLQPATVN